MNIKIAIAAAAVMFTSAANAVTFDFSTLAEGTAVTNQFPGLTVSLSGGVDSGPAIVANVFGGGLALTNSTTSHYPTAYTLNFDFSSAVTDVSFVFNNWGTYNGSYYAAYNGAALIQSGPLDLVDGFYTVNVGGSSGITSLLLNNANRTDWQVGVSSLTFTEGSGAVPEPQSWAMLIAGFGLVGAAMRRRSAAVAA